MKNINLSILIGFMTLIFALNTFAQDPSQWNLPAGAKARLGKGTVGEIAYSPDGARLAVASGIGIWLYDAHTGEALDLLTGDTDLVTSVSFSADGNTIASTGWDGWGWDETIRLWDAHTGNNIRTLTLGGTDSSGSVPFFIFSPDGTTTIASGSLDDTIHLWDTHTGEHLRTLTGHTDWVNSVAFSPDGNTIASASRDGTLRLWDAHTGNNIRTLTGDTDPFTGDTAPFTSVAFSPDGDTIASGSWGETYLWDAHTGEHLRTLTGHRQRVDSVSFSPDGKTIASGSWQEIRLWDAHTGNNIRTLTGHTSGVVSVAFSPDGTTIASRSWQEIRLWDARTGNNIRTLTGHTDSVVSVAFSPDGTTIASGSEYDTIRLWDAHTGDHIRTLTGHTHSVNSVSFSPDGNTIASSGGWDETIRLWDAHTGEHIRTLKGHTEWVLSVSFSPDGNTIASGSGDHTLRLWDARTGNNIRTLTGHTDAVSSVSFSPDGKTIASGSRDGTIRLWDTQTGNNVRTLTGHTDWVRSVSFSPDGSTIASASDDTTIRLWDAQTGNNVRTLTGHTHWVYSVSFSPDGKTIASGSDDTTIRLWDAQTGNNVRTLTGHTHWVYSVSFSPDGKTIASGSLDGTVLLWELAPVATSNATLSLSPASLQSPAGGEQLTFALEIADGENVAGYQVTVSYDTTALRYIESANGDYLPAGAFFIPPVAEGNTVTLAASSLAGESSGDGTLATITFEVVAVKTSTVRFTDMLLTDVSGGSSIPRIELAVITERTLLPEDVNEDGVVNIIDLTLVASNFGKTGQNDADVNGDGVVNIIDLTLVAGAFGNIAPAPALSSLYSDGMPTRATLEKWLQEARQLNLADPSFQRGIQVLENLLKTLTPKETALLPNYPNPFNPETWIPYQLASPAEVSLSIYAADGKLVRVLDFGHQAVGIYQDKGSAAYWDGRNAIGESVVSGVYFYTLSAGAFSATRKMLILK